MIKQLIFFLLLLTFTPIKAQQNLGSFVDESNLWYNYNDNFPYHQQLHIYYFFQGDTTIGSYTYKKMYEKGIDSTFNPNNGSLDHTINYPLHYEGAFRQEGQKVFAICNDCNINNEFLYIDFNMNVGDTVHYQPFGNTIRTVTAIDSVPFGNQYRKRYTTTGGRFYEGIGHEFGVFRDNSVGIEGNDYLSCFHQFGQTQNVYFWSENNTCHSYSSPTYNSQGALFSTFQSSQCSGSTFTIQAETSDYQNYQWNITGPGGYVSNPTGQNISLLLTQPGVYNVSLTVTYNGITETHSENSYLNVIPLPIVNAPSSFCSGLSGQLSPSNGGTWASSNTSIATVTNQGSAYGNGSGNVNFIFTDSQTGCSQTTPIVYIINQSAELPSLTMCVNGNIQLESYSAGGTWVSNNPTTANITNDGLVTALAQGVVTFTFTNATTGCSKTTQDLTIGIGINPTVIVPSPFCEGANVQLLPSTGGTWYATGIAGIFDNGIATTLASGLAPGIACFTYTDLSTGCSTSSSLINIIEHPSISIPSTVLCLNSVIQLSPNSGGAWYSNNPNIASITNEGLVSSITAGTVNFTYTDSITTCSNTIYYVTVSSLPQPTISTFDGEDSLACDGTLSVLVTDGTAPYSYSWTNGASNYTTSAIQDLCSGTYSLAVVDANGCSTTNSASINDTLIQNVLSDTLIFTDNIYQDSTIIGADTSDWIENCTFDYNLAIGANIVSYIDNGTTTTVNWLINLNNGTSIPIDVIYPISIGNSGVYEFTLQLFCSAKSNPKFIVATSQIYIDVSTIGIQSLSLNSVFLYPNPTNSNLTISGINSDFSYKISDLQGKLLKQGANTKQIEIENLPAGTYVIGISTDNEVKQLRFVKL